MVDVIGSRTLFDRLEFLLSDAVRDVMNGHDDCALFAFMLRGEVFIWVDISLPIW